MKQFTFADVFAGIGGFRRAFENLGGTCLLSVEKDKWCKQTQRANFTDHLEHVWCDDITQLAHDFDYPPIDLFCAGFPCQPFSQAGRKKGLKDPRGNLMFDMLRLIEYCAPRVILLENVPRLRSIDDGRVFNALCRALADLKYSVFHRVVCSSSWIPQKRKRIFIVGIKGELSPLFDPLDQIAFPQKPKPKLGDILENQVDPKYTLSANGWKAMQAHKKRHREQGHGFGQKLFGSNDVAGTLVSGKSRMSILIRQKGKCPRKLTPTECARLMGFEPWKINVSDHQAYCQFGNSVVVPLVQAIGTALLPYLQLKTEAVNN